MTKAEILQELESLKKKGTDFLTSGPLENIPAEELRSYSTNLFLLENLFKCENLINRIKLSDSNEEI